MKRLTDGIEVEMTPEENGAGEEDQASIPPPPPAPRACLSSAGAGLTVDHEAWEVVGIERSTGISGAWLDDDDVVIVTFSVAQPDTLYDVVPGDGVTKYAEYVVVTRPALAELNFIVQRVL